MIVVSDSSPLITLARAHHLELLHEFFGRVIVPREVYEEVTVAGSGLPGAEEVRRASWIQAQPSTNEPTAELMTATAGLGAGERHAIYLASAMNAELVLMDEMRARRVAKAAGIIVAGSLAILERGAKFGRVNDLRSVYLSLLAQRIWFHPKLLDESLTRLGLKSLGLK